MGLYVVHHFSLWAIAILAAAALLWGIGFWKNLTLISSRSGRALLAPLFIVSLSVVIFSPRILPWPGRDEGMVVLAIALLFTSYVALSGGLLLWYWLRERGTTSSHPTATTIDYGRRRSLCMVAGGVAASVNGVVFAGDRLLPERLEVTRYRFGFHQSGLLSTEEPFKLALFSDLHAGFSLSPALLQDLLQAIVREEVDLI
ncbi:MAG: hypothetical protein HQL48_07605, partial [Gammaproteobacteria bacterium]|nr:hypothetical protein [Gammaproteobacteria bacterium]